MLHHIITIAKTQMKRKTTEKKKQNSRMWSLFSLLVWYNKTNRQKNYRNQLKTNQKKWTKEKKMCKTRQLHSHANLEQLFWLYKCRKYLENLQKVQNIITGIYDREKNPHNIDCSTHSWWMKNRKCKWVHNIHKHIFKTKMSISWNYWNAQHRF